MSEPFLGQITMFGGNFAPRGWAYCNGQLLPISSNTALFSLLGTTYGGDGRTTFGLPDLRGRAPVHAGSGPGLTPVDLGQKSGANSTILNITQLPSHTHNVTVDAKLRANDSGAREQDPTGNGLGKPRDDIYQSGAPNVDMADGSVTATATATNAGGNQPVSLMQPYLGIHYIIALVGSYPSRN